MEKEKRMNIAMRRWLIRELANKRMSATEVLEHISPYSKNPKSLLQSWRSKYAPSIALTLPVMSEKEKEKLEAAQRRLKELERQLEAAQMKNIALETLIDVAEEELKIKIRKKCGPKQ